MTRGVLIRSPMEVFSRSTGVECLMTPNELMMTYGLVAGWRMLSKAGTGNEIRDVMALPIIMGKNMRR